MKTRTEKLIISCDVDCIEVPDGNFGDVVRLKIYQPLYAEYCPRTGEIWIILDTSPFSDRLYCYGHKGLWDISKDDYFKDLLDSPPEEITTFLKELWSAIVQ